MQKINNIINAPRGAEEGKRMESRYYTYRGEEVVIVRAEGDVGGREVLDYVGDHNIIRRADVREGDDVVGCYYEDYGVDVEPGEEIGVGDVVNVENPQHAITVIDTTHNLREDARSMARTKTTRYHSWHSDLERIADWDEAELGEWLEANPAPESGSGKWLDDNAIRAEWERAQELVAGRDEVAA
jgi:hypothetical protein